MMSGIFALVFVLGLRHGLDADHLACIDGLTRFNWQQRRSIAKWIGTFFSFGHGLVVTLVAVLLGSVTNSFAFPDSFDVIVTWVSIVSLVLIGTFNIRNLLRAQVAGGTYQPLGIKGKFLPRIVRETSNPLYVVLIGAAFAMAADTVSQTSVWVFASGHAGGAMPLILGLTFMAGMMIVDTIDSLFVERMMNMPGKLGNTISMVIGWGIVILAYGVALYEVIDFFQES